MKNRNYAKIFVLAISLVLLMTAAFGLSASADEVAEGGDIYSSTIIHDDKISIAFSVKATEAEIADGIASVQYYWGEDTENVKTAKYYGKHESKDGYVWVVTEGVAAYDLGLEAKVTSYYNEVAIDSGSYSVATFLYNKLYRDGVTGTAQECYEALLAYGAASQAYLNKNANAPVDALNYAYTKNADVQINDGSSAFASEVTLTYTGNFIVESWVVGGETYPAEQNTIAIDGVVEVDVVFAQNLVFSTVKGDYTVESGKWGYNVNTVYTDYEYEVVVYDSSFSGTLINDTFGMAYVIGSDGNLKIMYDGYNSNYYYSATDGTRVKFTTNYVQAAYAHVEEGDILVVLPRYYPDGSTMNPAVTWAQARRWSSYLGNDQYTGSPVGQAGSITFVNAEK